MLGYFNYHAKAKKLITQGFLINVQFVQKWNDISPALILEFTNEKSMPIRHEKWKYYQNLIAINSPEVYEDYINKFTEFFCLYSEDL